ncbi:hypothetical protein ABK040_001126 [Willaertia magna]
MLSKQEEEWNKALEGIDFSLSPFLQKCQQEANRDRVMKLFFKTLFQYLHTNEYPPSYVAYDNNQLVASTAFQENQLTDYIANQLNCTIPQQLNNKVREQQHCSNASDEVTLTNNVNAIEKPNKQRRSNSKPTKQKYKIIEEHPEISKPKGTKRGRPSKYELSANTPFQIVFLKNSFNRLKSNASKKQK